MDPIDKVLYRLKAIRENGYIKRYQDFINESLRTDKLLEKEISLISKSIDLLPKKSLVRFVLCSSISKKSLLLYKKAIAKFSELDKIKEKNSYFILGRDLLE